MAMGRIGLPGQMLEIRIGTRTLLLGRPGAIPPMLLKSSDKLGFVPFYARLAQDRIALQRLRAGWKAIAPAARSSQMDRVALVTELRTHIDNGRISAALLDPRSRTPPPGEARSEPSAPFAHIRSTHGDLVLAPRGQVPQGLRALQDNPAAAEFLRTLNRRDGAFVDLARHAKLLAGQDGIRTETVHSMTIRRLQNGTLDGVVIKSLVQRSRAAKVMPKGPDVGRMSSTDKVCEALLRAGPHLEGDVKAAWEELTKPENLLIMGGVFAAMGLAQLYPPAGLAIDAIVFVTAAFAIGWKSVEMLRAAIDATIVALRAQSEADLDKAGRHYADAFEALGAAALAALTARFAAKGLGRRLEQRAASKAASSGAKPKPVPGESPPPKKPPQTEKPSQNAAGASAELAAQRRATAESFYKKAGWSDEKIAGHLDGIDFSKPVEVITIPKNTKVVQFQIPGRPVGNYFCPEGSNPATLGIDTAGRTAKVFETTEEVSVLRSVAADMKDWRGSGEIFKGGGTQYFSPNGGTGFKAVGP